MTACRFRTGRVPGNPRQTAQVAEFGSAPTVTGHGQKILERVSSCAWTSRPMTGKTLILLGDSTADTREMLAPMDRETWEDVRREP